MEKEKRKRAYKLKRLRLLLIPLALVIIFSIFTNRKTAKNIATNLPIKTEYLDKVDSKGYLILKEKVYTSQGDGVVDYNVRDGERVPKDYIVANLNLMSDSEDLKKELLKVQSAIEYKNQSLNPSTSSFVITDKEINLINSIQDSLVRDNMQETLLAIETLELNTKKNVDISEISDLINLSNQELEDRRDDLSKEISTNNVVYKAEDAGIISYKVDGLEEVYNEENIEKIDYQLIMDNQKSASLGQRNSVKMGDPLYKIIDNFTYAMAIPVEDEKVLKTYSKDKAVDLLINSKISLKGRVSRVNRTSESKGVLIVSLNDKLSELGYDRVLNVSLIESRSDCFVIPTKAIVEVDNQTGVYILELNGLVKFRPIEILRQNEIDTTISIGDEKGYIKNKKGEDLRTLSAFEEVIIEPENIEEGEIL
ncbi:HlyD family efflux transporter periplasmic adaptor subunit [Neofamilia massiliensis]|uniref:HlyD family efflux transporter periplasmic adaptor subunit n=1 Tax=Neofamilia massiliensis TaxID=1673724 RepID=UPI0006BB6A30|nr:HlyD family efflux transporter periplasmic adaptor subunit [Neofamilia massiliensis]